MHGEGVDGDDLDAVVEAADRLLGAARDERRPAMLEAMTYRYRGHSVADARLAYGSKEEIAELQPRLTRRRDDPTLRRPTRWPVRTHPLTLP